MASPNSSPNVHFETLLSKRQLHEGMRFKPVDIREIEFGENGLNTSNLIEKIMELSNTDSVKNSGGFIVIRPKNDISIFTKGEQTTSIKTNYNNNNNNNNNNISSIWDSLPSLSAISDDNDILWEEQKASEFTVPLFSWNIDHKNAIIKQNTYKRTESELKKNNNKNEMEIDDDNNNNNDYKIGQKRKNTSAFDEDNEPHKRQKIDIRAPSPSLLSYNTNNTNNIIENSNGFTIGKENETRYFNYKDSEFYRGFCCMMQNNKNEYDKINIKKFINKINKINNNPYNNINSIE
eukprot:3630_1